MESIQGLSNWCIENKKYHSLIVRYWMKWLRKSEASHRLNLFYLANDVIQNCKRRNAIVYRTAFADVLPEAFQLVNNVGDSKVMKSVDRILTIWEERSVYTDELLAELRASLVKEESPAAVETPKAPVNPKAALQSKIVAEFVPQAFIDHLSKHHSSVEEVELKEKQLAAMRVDVCSTEALKRLKDKAGGKRHSKDFEDGSAKLKEFVAFLDRQIKGGPPLLDALGNADIFYEMQYKEVKIVANAYKTFANRVSHLKRKLDGLKATLPDLDESPIPSPSMDAPSPNGSESPFHGLADPDSDLDGLAMDDEADITLGEAPSPLSSPGGSPKQGFTVGESDNRDVEDMELSDEEAESVGIIVEERVESPIPSPVPIPMSVVTQPPLATEAKPVPQATPSPALVTPLTPTTNLSGNLANVDLGKISSILSSITSVMKKPGVSPGGSLASPSSPAKTTLPAPVAPQVAIPLASILSKVDMTSEALLSALSKTQGQASGLQGLSTLLNSPAGNLSSNSPSTGKLPPSTPTVPSRGLPLAASMLELTPSVGNTTTVPQAVSLPQPTLPLAIGPHRGLVLEQEKEKEEKPSASSLESKIHSFLQGNPGFNAFNLGLTSEAVQAGGRDLSPLAGTETQEGTPVRDEAGGGTPTLDEIMDTPGEAEPFLAKQGQVSTGGVPKPTDGNLSLSPTACHNQAWQGPNNTQVHLGLHPGAPNGQGYPQLPYEGKEEMHGIAPSLRESGLAHYQPITTQVSAPTLGEGLPSNTPGGPQARPSASVIEGGWYGNPYPEGQALHPSNHNMAASGAGDGKTPMSGPYAYQGEGQTQPYQTKDPHALPFQQGANPSSFLTSPLPPIPQLPPPPFPGIPAPPQDYQGPPASVMVGGLMVERPSPNPEMEDDRAGISALGGPGIISDPYHPDDFRRHPDVLHRHADDPYHPDDFRRHPDDLHRYSDDLRRQPDNLHHLDNFRHHPDDLRHPDDRYYHPDDFQNLPVDDPHYPYRVRERLTPPPSPSEDPYYYNYPPRSPSPPYGHRRPLPPHMNLHHHDHMPLPPHPPHSLLRPAQHPHLRGLPRGPPRPPLRSPMLRGKRPGPPFGGHPRGGGPGGPFFPPKRPHLPPRF